MNLRKNSCTAKNRVLIIGVYLLDIPNHALPITQALNNTKAWDLDIKWIASGHGTIPSLLQHYTILKIDDLIPKFLLLNQVLESIDVYDYEYTIVIDDDIELNDSFLDRFLWIQSRANLALAQPARTADSYIDHAFVTQQSRIAARQTRFVEVGPLFSMRQDIYQFLLPFDIHTPMGWGLDYYWPVLLESRGCRLGIIDAMPIRHKLRKPVSLYDYEEVSIAMERFLATHEHLTPEEAFINLKCYPLINHVPGLTLMLRGE